MDLRQRRFPRVVSLALACALVLPALFVMPAAAAGPDFVGGPIAKAAEQFGAGHWQTNAVYIFSNTGAFVTTALYCLYLAWSQETFGEFRRPKDLADGVLSINYLMALLTGCMWYGQFLFYGLGHVRMGQFKFSSWAIHMLMLILFSSLAGIILREWHGRSPRTKGAMIAALLVVGAAVLVLSYGNSLGG